MLKIVGSAECQNTVVEFGDYLPFQFSCQSQRDGAQLYWRTGDLKSTLLEVKIDQMDGQIVGAALLLPGRVSNDFPSLDLSCSACVNGYPKVTLNGWPDGQILDQPGPFEVFADASRLLMVFSTSITISKKFVSQNIVFGVDANDSLIWILVEALQAEKLVSLTSL